MNVENFIQNIKIFCIVFNINFKILIKIILIFKERKKVLKINFRVKL